MQVRRIRHVGYCSWRKDEFVRVILQWISTHKRASVGRPAVTYLQRLCADKGCSFEDLSLTMHDRDGWRKSSRGIHVSIDDNDDAGLSVIIFNSFLSFFIYFWNENIQMKLTMRGHRNFKIEQKKIRNIKILKFLWKIKQKISNKCHPLKADFTIDRKIENELPKKK